MSTVPPHVVITKVTSRVTLGGPDGESASTFRFTVSWPAVSFKDVADVLGHQSIETTGIYAKLELDALAAVALPWGGDAL